MRVSVFLPKCAVGYSSSSSTSWLKPVRNQVHLMWFHEFFLANVCRFTKFPISKNKHLLMWFHNFFWQISADLYNFRFWRISVIWPSEQQQHKFAFDWRAPPKSLREERKDRGSTIGQKGHSLLTRLITCHYFCMKPLKPNKAKPSTCLSVVRSNAASVSLI